VDRRTEVLKFSNDEATEYVILSHRWVREEVDCGKMAKLAKMAVEKRDEIRQRKRSLSWTQTQSPINSAHSWSWMLLCPFCESPHSSKPSCHAALADRNGRNQYNTGRRGTVTLHSYL